MHTKLYQKCCRLCLDDTKEQIEVCSDDRLAETLQQLYNVKVEKTDQCTKKICVECFKEANEMQKWLKFYEEQKKLIAENQQIFNDELINQLGPATLASPEPSSKSVRSKRSTARKSFARTDDEEEERGEKDEDFIPKKSPRIKKESVKTRRSIKSEWLPHSDGSGQESSTPTEHASDDDEEEEDASETATSTTDDDLKCPKCEKVFREIDQLERHSCEFICSVCSATLKYRHSLKRHLMAVHKIKASQWEDYWSPVGDNPEELLVVTSKPKKRYRYESDSPTDIEEDSNSDGQQPKDLVCSRCGDKFDSSQDLKTHDCDYLCNICGVSFASRTNVKRHKIRVHKIDPSDPSLVLSRSRAASRAGSRPPSRPPSRAASEHPSDDEPLSALAFKNIDPQNTDDFRQRFFCPDCDYSNYKRNRITHHLLTFHRTPKEQIDVEAIPKKYVPKTAVFRSRSKTPTMIEPFAYRSKTPTSIQPTAYRSKTPTSIQPTAYRSKTPDPSRIYCPPITQPAVAIYQPAANAEHLPVAQPFASQHRSRSRSIHQDSRNSSKRKRSLSSSSSKSARLVRARSNPPVERNILVAKRRLSPSRALAQVPEKLRPTVTGIESNRLFVSIRQSCEDFPLSQQIRIRATSYVSQEPCPTKRLFKLKPPIGAERQQAQNLRGVFRNLSHQISSQSKVNSIDIDSLVLDLIHQTNQETQEPLINTEMESQQQEEHDAEIATFEIREVDSDEASQEVVAGHEMNVLEEEPSNNAGLEAEVAGSMENGETQAPIEVDEIDEDALVIVEFPEEIKPSELADSEPEGHEEDVSIIPD
ncbi:uncharacterized protein LOC135706420 [Ochlerotatus camptorhynchus]|uniref:uncharacterized protein LOC135706420 n=1 Tax=Ochlerotatus camptorhynchus TaxID=644619 RepID=UPI0031D41EE3